eukprot:CAMPEP_0184343240 /NCGR_PEP_ID=MMETSP1089-20130417/11777_1 /TAXON_ID=38269 ORGANISM="Gloeochaete wittrockiana, Strain SAG46.84" /NCGR_SAMPLE_ID=MMETSP1089 /ASSEMBLY_ACC=CAM_ASM_000445 /LENGTH=970 /DNA_ID=CAMNT_0026672457 /DNA_START=93 /DNA_END=3005 /DNA_ORIENTATION=+
MAQVEETELKWSTTKVRSTFISFFEGKGHDFVRSSSVIPHNDPTIKFANAGMNQFKPIFLGTADPSSYLGKLKRAANTQKCIRAGGKHNDLDDVGKDSYHHTFFEMLGNWSFGDYFKTEAIQWAWELLTSVYGLDPSRLYVTYFGGNAEFNLEPDTETRDLWINLVGIPPSRVLPFGMKENFWEMGFTGPCGPCTEIHYDRVGGRDVADLVNMDDPEVIEIWNLVFIQYNREDAKTLNPLPSKHVDTGMGLERITSILQEKMSNYDIDMFQEIFRGIQEVTGTSHSYSGKYGADDAANKYLDTAYRVIADHIRTLLIALTDGARPSATDRGSIIRRILRRAARYGGDLLGAPTGFFSQLVPKAAETLKDAFPDLVDPENIRKVQEILLAEEKSFEKLLKRGIKRFNKAIEGKPAAFQIPGELAAILHHTDGFPIDLTIRMAEESGMSVNLAEYEEAMKRHQELSKNPKLLRAEGDRPADFKNLNINIIDDLKTTHLVLPTDDKAKYQEGPVRATLKAIWNGFEFVDTVDEIGQVYGLFLDATNFYAEQGGQVHDTGSLSRPDGSALFEVSDVQLNGGSFVLHIGRYSSDRVDRPLKVNEEVELVVDYKRRHPIRANHTATHLTNHALLQVLGSHVAQKGSEVLPESFRFDYSAKGKPEPDQLRRVEELVNLVIDQGAEIFAQEVPRDLALRINGLRTIENEDYPDPVRVISVGVPIDDLLADPSKDWSSSSIELCGGTHLSNTKLAKAFALVREEALAAEVRRVICVTGSEALAAFDAASRFELALASASALSVGDLVSGGTLKTLEDTLNTETMPTYRKASFRQALKDLQKTVLDHQKLLSKGKASLAADYAQSQVAQALETKAKFVVLKVEDYQRKALSDLLKTVYDGTNLPVLILNKDAKKIDLMVQVPAPAQASLAADVWAKTAISSVPGAKSGGKADRANGAISSPDSFDAIATAAHEFASLSLQ